jgi:hypothetical protein
MAHSPTSEKDWEECDTSILDGPSGTHSEFEYLTDPLSTRAQADSSLESHISADDADTTPPDVDISACADETTGVETTNVDAETAPRPSRVSLRRRRLPSVTEEDSFCSDCELLIHTDHLLKCNGPSCTEKVVSLHTWQFWTSLM